MGIVPVLGIRADERVTGYSGRGLYSGEDRG